MPNVFIASPLKAIIEADDLKYPVSVFLQPGSQVPGFKDQVFLNGQLRKCLRADFSKDAQGHDQVVIQLFSSDSL